jgi:hypothetical protein
MKLSRVIPGAAVAVCLAAAVDAEGAFVNLTLYNTFALLDANGATPLSGSASSGDLVQLILAGANGSIDAPGVSGSPGGDDTVLPVSMASNPTHVGAGLGGSNHGLLYQINILYTSTYAGASAYIRFWNGGQPWTSTHYGQTAIFSLPSGDVFGEAEYNFVPLASSPRSTLTEFDAENPVHVPEPSLFAFGAIVLGVLTRLRSAVRRPEAPPP